jgi:hypothetical protein
MRSRPTWSEPLKSYFDRTLTALPKGYAQRRFCPETGLRAAGLGAPLPLRLALQPPLGALLRRARCHARRPRPLRLTRGAKSGLEQHEKANTGRVLVQPAST